MSLKALVAIGMFSVADTTAVNTHPNPQAGYSPGAWDYVEVSLDDDSSKQFLSLFQNDISLQRIERIRVDTELGAASWVLIVLACIAVFAVLYIVMEIRREEPWDTSKMGVRSSSQAPMGSPLIPASQLSQSSSAVMPPPIPGTMSPGMPTLSAPSSSSLVPQRASPMPQRAPVPAPPPSEIAAVPYSDGSWMTKWLTDNLQIFQPKAPNDEKTQTLVVQSLEGVILQSSDNAIPHAEQRTIIFHSLKGGNQVIRAKIEERTGQPRILVESASGVPLASLDTSSAISRNGMFTQKDRRVNIHRVPLIGPPFSFTNERPYASVVRIAPGSFLVTNDTKNVQVDDIGDVRNVAGFVLLVKADSAGNIQEMRDKAGDCVVRQEAVGYVKRNLWMRRGCDVSLVVSVALAVQKLGV